jgi:hypothetical protein
VSGHRRQLPGPRGAHGRRLKANAHGHASAAGDRRRACVPRSHAPPAVTGATPCHTRQSRHARWRARSRVLYPTDLYFRRSAARVSLPPVAVAQTRDEPAGSVLRLASANGRVVRHAPAAARQTGRLSTCGTHFRERAAPVPSSLYATATPGCKRLARQPRDAREGRGPGARRSAPDTPPFAAMRALRGCERRSSVALAARLGRALLRSASVQALIAKSA